MNILQLLFIFQSLNTIRPSKLNNSELPRIQIDLNKNWTIINAPRNILLKNLTLPISVHTALLKANLINDPYYRFNDTELRWIINDNDWVFQTYFQLETSTNKSSVICLEFDSIDTIASVYLNNKFILSARNQFIKYEIFHVNEYLNYDGDNFLQVKFSSAVQQAKYLGKIFFVRFYFIY